MDPNNRFSHLCPICGCREIYLTAIHTVCKKCGYIYNDTLKLSNVSNREEASIGGILGTVVGTRMERRIIKEKNIVAELVNMLRLPESVMEEALPIALYLRSKGVKPRLSALTAVIYVVKKRGYILTYSRIKRRLSKEVNLRWLKYSYADLYKLMIKYGLKPDREKHDPLTYIDTALIRIKEEIRDRVGIDINKYLLELRNKASEIYRNYRDLFRGRSASMIAAALLYVSDTVLARERGSKKVLRLGDIAKHLNISKYGLRETLRNLYNKASMDQFRVKRRHRRPPSP